MSELPRRAVLQGLAAAAAASSPLERTEALEWEHDAGGTYISHRGTFEHLYGHLYGGLVHVDLEADDFTDHRAEVMYDRSGIHLNIDAESDEVSLGALAKLTNEQAREIAIALWQAAEEQEMRNAGESGE